MPTARVDTDQAAEIARQADEIARLRQDVAGLMADLMQARDERDAAQGELAATAGAIVREMPPHDPGDDRLSVVELVAIASGRVGPIPKGEKMEGRGESYTYRGIEQITERAQGVFAELRIVLVPHRCSKLDYEDVQNARGTKGRHYLATWLWRAYGPRMDFIEFEAPGECAEWGGDKGANKTFTGSRKNALTALLNLADKAADPDSYQPEESVHRDRQQAQPEQQAIQYATPEWWQSWKDVRDALRGSPEAEKFKAWCTDNGFDLAKPATLTVGQAAAVEAKAREAFAALFARTTEQPAADMADVADVAGETSREVQQAQAAAEAARTAQDADAEAAATQAAPTPTPATEAPSEPQEAPPAETTKGPASYWRCGNCSADVKGHVGDPCPVCKSGVLSDEEPF